jgi:ATPase family associated with various cellular activities (AAA)
MSTASDPNMTPEAGNGTGERSPTSDSRSLAMLRKIFAAGRPLTYIRSAEERRVGQLLREAARRFFTPAIPVWTWSLTEGMQRDDGDPVEALAPRAALDFIATYQGAAIFHLKDFHEPMQASAEIRRRLRDLYERCIDADKFVVISSPIRFLPEEIARDIVYVELGLPDLIELRTFLLREGERAAAIGATVESDEGTLHQLAQALQGLTLSEAHHAVRRAVAETKMLGPASVPILLEEKRLLVSRSGLVEYVADGTDIGHVGGLEHLKKWLLERRKLFAMRDSIGADIVPKGVLIMGISGCGKSLSVKAVASYFGLPLYRINMTDIFSGLHGPAEAAFTQACRMCEEIAPAVVWFDEIEMGLTSQESSGEQGRMFAFFLTWMQEKARGLFVAATANRIDLLPAEMIRKGRFDEVFFVDLPIDDERVEIFKIHLQRRGIDPAGVAFDQLKRFSKGWTGAEIEQCVVSALSAARLQDRELNDDDLQRATLAMVPLSKTMREQVERIRGWASDRAVRASPRV